MSSVHRDYMYAPSHPAAFSWIRVMTNYSHQDLDLSDRFTQESKVFVDYGGFSDVFKGMLLAHSEGSNTSARQDGSQNGEVVAIKTFRVGRMNEVKFRKVSSVIVNRNCR